MNIIAHRGYSRCFPENSLAAFQAIITHPRNGKNLIGIELDIHLCADNHIVVMHETELKNRHGASIPVSQLSFEAVQQLFHANHPNRGHRIPELNDVLELIDHQTELCLEIKAAQYDRRQFNQLLVDLLARYQPSGDIVLSSFSCESLESMMTLAGGLDIRYGMLIDSWDAWERLSAGMIRKVHYIHPRFTLLFDRPERLAVFPVPVQCWTVNSMVAIKRLMSLPGAGAIRSIMTDDISLAEQFPDE